MENIDRRSPNTGDYYALVREDASMKIFEKKYLSPDFDETLKLEIMYECLVKALSSTPEVRRDADAKLIQMSSHPNFAVGLARVVAASLSSFSNEFYPEDKVRKAAAAKLKQHLIVRSPIPCCWERDRLKSIIFCLLLSLPDSHSEAETCEALSDALDVLCGDDAESSWHLPLLQLFYRFRHSAPHASSIAQFVDAASILASRLIAPSPRLLPLFRKYGFLPDFGGCLDKFVEPLYDIFFRIDAFMDEKLLSLSSAKDSAVLRFLLDSLLLCHRIFCSTTLFALTGLFRMPRWHDHCLKHLSLEAYHNHYHDSPNGLGLSQVPIAMCETLAVLLHRWPSTIVSSQFPLSEKLALPLITLLEALSANTSSSGHPLFIPAIRVLIRMWDSLGFCFRTAWPFIGRILHNIVIPNLHLRDEDLELFHSNYLDFISLDLDMESLSLSRRCTASKLLTRLANDYTLDCDGVCSIDHYYEDTVVPLVWTEVGAMISLFLENPGGNWKAKECAIQLVLSLVPEEDTRACSAVLKEMRRKLNRRLDTALHFFTNVILPELQSQDVNEFPVLKAAALKFFAMFYTHVPRLLVVKLIPHVVRFLGSDSIVVRSYAAISIEKLFLAMDSSKCRTRATDISRFVPTAVINLCDALKIPCFEANPYIMKCIKQVLGMADVPIEIFEPCFASLASLFHEVCFDSVNHLFYRYLFEALAVLVRGERDEDSAMIPVFEAGLFPIFHSVFDNNMVELFPYASQLLAHLVDLNMTPLSPNYIQLLYLVLSHDQWKRSSNAPHFVVLLKAFLEKASIQLIEPGSLVRLLHIFEVLASSPSTEESGFHMLNAILVNLEYDLFAPLAANIWPTIYRLLQHYPTVKFLKSLIIYLSLFVVKHGAARLESSTNDCRPDFFLSVLELYWIPSLKFIKGAVEVKLTAVASIMLLLRGSATFRDALGAQIWGKMLDSVVTLLTQSKHNGIEEN